MGQVRDEFIKCLTDDNDIGNKKPKKKNVETEKRKKKLFFSLLKIEHSECTTRTTAISRYVKHLLIYFAS